MFFIINDIKKKLKKIRYRLHKKSLNGTSNISHRSNIEQASKTIKIIGHILKNKKKSGCIHEIILLIIVKKIMKMKNRSHRDDINSPRSRQVVNIRIVSV